MSDNTFDDLDKKTPRQRLLLDAGTPDTRHAIDEIVRELNRPGPHRKVFQYGGQTMVMMTDRSMLLRTAEGNKPVVRSIPRPANRGLLSGPVEAVTEWQKWDARTKGYETRPVPPWVYSGLIDIRGEGLKPLAGVADFPVVNGAGKLLVGRTGYDPESCLYVDCEPVPHENHSFESPREAYRFLVDEWLKEFAFASEEDRARALAIPMALMMRRTRISGGCPIPFVTAPMPETGKTMLVQCLVEVVTDAPIPVSGWDHDNEAERRKTILSIAMENPGAVLFDNINNGWAIADASLDKYATSDYFSDRLLGKNETATAPSTALLIFTGNNIIPGSIDFETRCFMIRLQLPKVRKAYERRNPRDWTRKHRAKIVAALLTIINAKRDPAYIPQSRFPDFSEFIAGPLQQAAENKNLFKAWAPSGAKYHNEELEALLFAMANTKYDNSNDYGYTPGDMSKLFSSKIHALDPKLSREWMEAKKGMVDEDAKIPAKQIYKLLRRYDGHLSGNWRLSVFKAPLAARSDREGWHFKALREE